MDVLPQQDSEVERQLQEISDSFHVMANSKFETYFNITNDLAYKWINDFDGERTNRNLKLWMFLCKRMSDLCLSIAVRISKLDIEDERERINPVFAEAAQIVLNDRAIEEILLIEE